MFRNFQRAMPLCMAVCGALCVAPGAQAADADLSKGKYGVSKPLGDTFAASPEVDGGQSLLWCTAPPPPKTKASPAST